MTTPPTFVTGQVLTAAQMNTIGMHLIKTQTVGTSVASVTVTGAFSADYDNYKIVWTGGVLSATALVYVYMGSGSGTGYYGGRVSVNTLGAAAFAGNDNAGGWYFAGVGNTDWVVLSFDLYNPFRTDETAIHSQYFERTNALGIYTGYLANTTSYSSFTFATNTGTMTGGTIRVYGYRN